MKKFHEDENLNKLVNICLENKNNQIFFDVVDLISLRDVFAVDSTLNLLAKDYEIKDLKDLFIQYQNCFKRIYGNSTQNNLRGAFLELLAFKIFSEEFDYKDYSMDCNVVIDQWVSRRTVDIGMLCEDHALACESKISDFYFSKEIFENLLEIKSNSDDFFSVCIVTLASKRSITEKIDKIGKDFENPDELNRVHVLTRSDLANFSFN